jgi:CubicO group peptidase (beta-lactamase class C family)
MRYQLAISMLLLATESTAATSRAARIGAVETGLRPATHVQGTNARRWTLAERMKLYGVPGVSIAVIRAGRVAWARGYGVLQAGRPDRVDAATLFSIGSLSKVATAAVTLRLVDAGRLDLDTDVARFVTRWHLPPDPFTAVHPVTLRGLLSHTAGLSLKRCPARRPRKPKRCRSKPCQARSQATRAAGRCWNSW